MDKWIIGRFSPIDGLGSAEFTYVYYAEDSIVKLFDEMEAILHTQVNRTVPEYASESSGLLAAKKTENGV